MVLIMLDNFRCALDSAVACGIGIGGQPLRTTDPSQIWRMKMTTETRPQAADPVYLTSREVEIRLRRAKGYMEVLRWKKESPPFVKIGRSVLYRLTDIEAWEAKMLQDGGVK
jgi:hypothetical protein